MKKYKLLLSLLIAAFQFQACMNSESGNEAMTKENDEYMNIHARACSFSEVDSAFKHIRLQLVTADTQELSIFEKIMATTGLPQNFKVYTADIPDALAIMQKDERLIICNKQMLKKMIDQDSTNWSVLFILTHTIGHHLANHLSDSTNLITAELEADRFAAGMLYKMGADSGQVLRALRSGIITNQQDTRNHPALSKRISAVSESWQNTAGIRYNTITPPSMDDSLQVNSFEEADLVYNTYVTGSSDALHGKTQGDIGQYFTVQKQIQGVIVSVIKETKSYDEISQHKNGTFIKVLVSITKGVPDYFVNNKKYTFSVAFEPRSGKASLNDFYAFFAPGRKIEFNVIDLFEGYDSGENFMTRVKTL
ncbi:MAG: hypothetical protein JNJ58_00590 [Chitinophagaceae bacterium]|nr:hypothetical protein [Chitinophagaceae bacterium]